MGARRSALLLALATVALSRAHASAAAAAAAVAAGNPAAPAAPEGPAADGQPPQQTCLNPAAAGAAAAGARPAAGAAPHPATGAGAHPSPGLWGLYYQGLRGAKYIDLSHVVAPRAPVWKGFASPQAFRPARNGAAGRDYSYEKDGFEATEYHLTTDQLGTQLDPPAHWDPWYASIDEIPASYALRPLVVIPILGKLESDPGHQMTVDDVTEWEAAHGRVPPGAVVMIRSDYHKRWGDPDFAGRFPFPGVTLDALKLLHLERGILFHGHEPLDTDTTPGLEGEAWLLHNGFAQAEGVANLDLVPETGCLIAFGFPRLAGGTGGYARYVAVCPAEWPHGVTAEETAGPLPRQAAPLRWDAERGHRVRA